MPKKEPNKAQEYLKRVELCDIHIDSLIEDLARLEARATKTTSAWNSEPGGGSGNQDKIGDAVAKIADLKREINEEIDAFVDMKKEVRILLNKITNSLYLEILYKRYFSYETWEQIAYEMGYDKRHITRKHGEALLLVMELLESCEDE